MLWQDDTTNNNVKQEACGVNANLKWKNDTFYLFIFLNTSVIINPSVS